MTVTTSLGEIIEQHGGLIQTGPFGSQLHQSDYLEEGIPVVMPKDIRHGRVDESDIARISEIKAQALSRHFLKPGSIVFPRRGEIGKCAYIDADQEGFLCGTGCIKIEPPEGTLRSKFLYYYLGLRQAVEWLERNAVGTTMLNLSTKILGGLNVPLFSTQTQDSIASILSAYDDLIENNRRRIQLLEQAARLLYKEWFVHLRFPGHEHVTITDGVPEGWGKTTAGSVSSFISRGTMPKYDDEAPGIVLNQKCIRNQRVEMGLARRQSKQVSPDKFVRYGDVLINSTGQGTLGRVGQFLGSTGNCTVDSHVTIARPSKDISVQLYGHSLASREGFLAVMGRGATNQSELARKTVAELPFLRPPHPLAERFETFAKETASQVQNLMQQNTSIAQARDLLLPRLMDGEVTV